MYCYLLSLYFMGLFSLLYNKSCTCCTLLMCTGDFEQNYIQIMERNLILEKIQHMCIAIFNKQKYFTFHYRII